MHNVSGFMHDINVPFPLHFWYIFHADFFRELPIRTAAQPSGGDGVHVARGASFLAAPIQLCAEHACSRLRWVARSSRRHRRRGHWQDTSRSTPSQPGLDGNDRVEIGTVQKDRLDELDPGSDDGRSKDLSSMPPSKPAQRETQEFVTRSSSNAPSASSVLLLTTARSSCAA
jgi:hypothetical protein